VCCKVRSEKPNHTIAQTRKKSSPSQTLRFADGALELAVTGYSLHHISDPARVIREMARVVKHGGRVGLIDIIAPEVPKVRALNHCIEWIRDPSHSEIRPPFRPFARNARLKESPGGLGG
jgi:ubiquinone/menaquinone biosynthesis C-methylase UbiE